MALYLHSHYGMTPGPSLNIEAIFPGMGIPMLKIRQSWDHLIFHMGIPTLALYVEMAPLEADSASYHFNSLKPGDAYMHR